MRTRAPRRFFAYPRSGGRLSHAARASHAASFSLPSAAYSLSSWQAKLTMPDRARLWTLLAVFQVLFGVAVFAITRHYYRADSATASGGIVRQIPAVQPWPQTLTGAGPALSGSAPPAAALTDPAEISRLADAAYSARQYNSAAELYERLLTFDATDVDVHNNLQILCITRAGPRKRSRSCPRASARDPLHQRSWLALGFVNSQLGNVEDARTALTNAVQTGTDEQIRNSAQTMLGNLPPPP